MELPSSWEMKYIRRLQAKSGKDVWIVPLGPFLNRLRILQDDIKDLLSECPSMRLFRHLVKERDAILIREFLQ